MIKTFTCLACKSLEIKKLIDFCDQPVSHHYISKENDSSEIEYLRLSLCQCYDCGLIQLEETAGINSYKIFYPWVRQSEPESHLDDLVRKITCLTGITKNSTIWGLSYKDKTTVDRFSNHGFKNCNTMDYNLFLNSGDQKNNIVLIQSIINKKSLKKLQSIYGKPNVVICRHLLEHSHETSEFIASLKMLVEGGNYVVIELPDCSRHIQNLDYTMLWEEHITYYTENSIKSLLSIFSMQIVHSEVYEYPYENCLTLIVTDNLQKDKLFVKEKIIEGINAFNNYSDSFKVVKTKINTLFKKLKSKNKKLAIYGSGHIASTFINIFDLKKYIEFVIDDDKNKFELLMPGNGLSIVPSDKIISENIDVCFTAMSYENEQKVVKNNSKYLKMGGLMISISPNAKNSIYKMF